MDTNNLFKNKKELNFLKKLLSPQYEISSLEFSSIINSPQIQSLMDDFYDLTGIGIGIEDLNGTIHVSTGWQEICAEFHRKNPISRKTCIESDITLTKKAKPGEFTFFKCDNNMWDIATPIYFGEKRIGTLFIGQFFFEDEEIDRDIFIKQAERYGFDKEKYLKALDKVRRYSREKVDTAMRFYTKFASSISNLSYTNVKMKLSMQELKVAEGARKQSEEMFKTVVQRSPIGIGIVDERGKLIRFNDAFAHIIGYSRSELESTNFSDFTHKEDLKEEWKLIQDLLSGKKNQYRMKKRYIHKDGHYVWVDVVSSLMTPLEGTPRMGFAFIRDITEDLKAENNLKEERDRSNFYKDLLAHDMGNILNNIKVSIELMRTRKEQPPDSVDTSELFNIVEYQIIRGASLISNVRKLSEFEKTTVRIKCVDLSPILTEAIEQVKTVNFSKEIHIFENFKESRVFVKAGVLLKDAFSNILLNSMIYNDSSIIEITVKVSEIKYDVKEYIKIEFLDNGIGIEDCRKEEIFERSQRTDTSKGGMGIGLSLVKSIVKSYNGRIWVEDRLEGDHTKGSNFVLLLEKAMESCS